MLQSEVKSLPNEDISILITPDNYSYHFICECGDASNLTVKECQNTEAIFISHTHIDHFINFDLILRHQIGIGKRVVICGPEGIIEQVQSKIRGYQWNLISSDAIIYEIREIGNDGKIKRAEITPPTWEIVSLPNLKNDLLYSNDACDVTFTILDHKTASIAYLFKEKAKTKIDMRKSPFPGGSWVRELKKAFEEGNESTRIIIGSEVHTAKDLFPMLEIQEGDTLGVIMDHAATVENHQKIKALFADCQAAYIESFYLASDRDFADANYHSYSTASAKIMRESGVKKAIPVHFSRKYQKEEIETIEREFMNEFQKK